MGIKIAPSILSADFSRLGEQVRAAEEAGADYIHVDVMDGHFVPNLTMGPGIVAAVRASTSLPVDVHLMIESPERLAESFAEAGASILTVHQEACPHLDHVLSKIRRLGLRAGVAINPGTPIGVLEEVLDQVDLVLVMTVNPGFGGQRLIRSTVEKVRRLAAQMAARGIGAELEVDGGVDPENAGELVAAGARVLVAGSSIFDRRGTVAANLSALRRGAEAAL
ncbi:MAG: ribulose-phosphate 3-epimerase [Sphingomonadaceae bacterium]